MYTCDWIRDIYPAALLLGGCRCSCEFRSAVVNCFSTIEAIINLYNLARTTLQCCILAIACDRSPWIWGGDENQESNKGSKHNMSLMLDVYLFRRAHQTGRWSWAPDYSFLLLPTGSLNVSGHVHRLCVHLDCSPSYYSWRLSHPAMQGNLGKDKRITTIRSNFDSEFCFLGKLQQKMLALRLLTKAC